VSAAHPLPDDACRRCGADFEWRRNRKGTWSRWCRRCVEIRAGRPSELQRLREVPSGLLVRFPAEPDPADALIAAERVERLRRAVNELPLREREILKSRWGLAGTPQLTLDECARVWAVTRERIRQIEAKAVRRLQHRTRARRIDPSMVEHRTAAGHVVWREA